MSKKIWLQIISMNYILTNLSFLLEEIPMILTKYIPGFKVEISIALFWMLFLINFQIYSKKLPNLTKL